MTTLQDIKMLKIKVLEARERLGKAKDNTTSKAALKAEAVDAFNLASHRQTVAHMDVDAALNAYQSAFMDFIDAPLTS